MNYLSAELIKIAKQLNSKKFRILVTPYPNNPTIKGQFQIELNCGSCAEAARAAQAMFPHCSIAVR